MPAPPLPPPVVAAPSAPAAALVPEKPTPKKGEVFVHPADLDVSIEETRAMLARYRPTMKTAAEAVRY
jgi:hypothetical protein